MCFFIIINFIPTSTIDAAQARLKQKKKKKKVFDVKKITRNMRAYKLKHMETKHIKFVSQIHKISIKNRNIFIFPLLATEKRRGICVYMVQREA